MNELIKNMRASLLRDLDQALEQESVPHELATLVLLMEAARKLEHINRILAKGVGHNHAEKAEKPPCRTWNT